MLAKRSPPRCCPAWSPARSARPPPRWGCPRGTSDGLAGAGRFLGGPLADDAVRHDGTRQYPSVTTPPDVIPYVVPVWEFASWGALGAAANIGVVFLEASRRVKAWPWDRPKGPGGGVYAASVLIQLGIATVTTAALATAAIVTNAFVAFGIGAAAPSVVKKVARYAEGLIPSNDDEQVRCDREDDNGA
jgi:hypothetical protein